MMHHTKRTANYATTAVALITVGILSLTACTNDKPNDTNPVKTPPGLITKGDLGVPVAEEYEIEYGTGSVRGVCVFLQTVDSVLRIDSRPDSIGHAYALEGDDMVSTSLIEIASSQEIVAKARTALKRCLTETDQSDPAHREAPLKGLPQGALGYRATGTASDTESADFPLGLEKVFAPVSEDRLVVVALEWRRERPDLDIHQLLDIALERAKEVE